MKKTAKLKLKLSIETVRSLAFVRGGVGAAAADAVIETVTLTRPITGCIQAENEGLK